MKTISSLIPLSALMLAGCAHQGERHAYRTTHYPSYTVMVPRANQAAGGADTNASAAGAAGSTIGFNTGRGQNATNVTTFYSSDIFSTDMADNNLVSKIREAVNKDTELGSVAPAIQIGASQGTVALFGQVRSEQEKQKVEELARMTTGVATVNNQIQVASVASTGSPDTLTATSRADGDTQRDVNTRAGINGSAVQSGDEVAASGTNALSATSRDGAESEVFPGASGVQRGAGEQLDATSRPGSTGGVTVQVQGSSQTDRSLAQQISQELRSDTALSSAISGVSISVNDGRVTLIGSVRNEVQKREIESAVQRITGVSSVDNQLRVSSSSSLPHNP